MERLKGTGGRKGRKGGRREEGGREKSSVRLSLLLLLLSTTPTNNTTAHMLFKHTPLRLRAKGCYFYLLSFFQPLGPRFLPRPPLSF